MIDQGVQLFSNGDYWQATYRDADGRRRRKSIGPKSELSKAAARRKCNDLAAQLAKEPGRREAGKAPALGPWLDRYIGLRTDLDTASLVNHRGACTWLREFFGADTRMDKITRARAEDFRAWLPGRPKKSKKGEPVKLATFTVHKLVSLARQIFGWALDEGAIGINPFDRVRVSAPKIAREWRHVSSDETEKLIGACFHGGWRCLIALCRLAGLRRGEALRLTWENIDWGGRTLTVVPSGGVETTKQGLRVVPIQPRLYEILEAAWQAVGLPKYLVCPMSHNNIEEQVDSIMRTAGLKPWPKPLHTLRKNLVTDWQAQYPPLDVARWLGHDVKVAAKHYHQTKNDSIAKVTGGKSEIEELKAKVAELEAKLKAK